MAIPEELQVIDQKTGEGDEAVKGKLVVVHYRGWLYDDEAEDNKGQEFDSSYEREPFTIPLGAGVVVKGWEEGLVGMKTGGLRTLIIPPELAYGSNGAGDVIPPDAALIFEVELLQVRG